MRGVGGTAQVVDVVTRVYDFNWLGREFGMPESSAVEPNAPVAVIDDHRATRRVVDLTTSDEETLLRAFELIDQGRELLAKVEREMQWRLEARKAACTLEEVCS